MAGGAMKSTWFGNRKRYDFARCLQDADPGQHAWNIYPSWAECALIALRQAVIKMRTGSIDDDLEAKYMGLIERVKHPKKYSEALAILTMGLEEDASDFLGDTLGEWGVLNKWNGQFFTPRDICRLMARMNIGAKEPDDKNTFTICEPACGGGAMAIAVARHLQEQGFYPWHYHITCIDVDWRMFATCYIQLTLLGIPAGVIHGNALTVEQWDSAPTLTAVLHPVRRQDISTGETAASHSTPKNTTPISAPVPDIGSVENEQQLTLF
jgi:hypothetical protein